MKRYISIVAVLLFSAGLCAQTVPAGDSLQPAPAPVEAEEPQTAASAADSSDGPAQLWESANAAYVAGDYDRAVGDYTRILDGGLHSAALYYNLANALFKRGELGRAILYYNRALRLSPSDEDIRHNLEYAERMTKDNIEAVPEFFLVTWLRSVRSSLSCSAWTVLSLAAFAALLALGLLYMLSQRLAARKAGFYGMAVALLFFVVTSLFAWGGRRDILDRSEAVVMGSSVPVKSSPDRSATDLFVLHEGTKVTIGDTLEGWAEIRIADGNKGWIELGRIERI